MFKLIKCLCFVTIVSGVGTSFAQLSKSPYSIQGIGDLQGMGLISNESMGGTGIALGSQFHINTLNPALLPLNYTTTFDIGAVGETRNLKKDSLSQSNSTLNIGYMAFAFPVIKGGKMTVSMGLKPYSQVEYNIQTKQNISGSSSKAEIEAIGTGGINQAYLALGGRIKNLFIGARAGYYFGSIIDETTVKPFLINDQDTLISSYLNTNYYRRTSYSDVDLGLGVAYSVKLNNNYSFSMGGTYDLQTTISSKKLELLEQQRYFDNQVIQFDTIAFNENGSISLPSKFGLGISLQNGLRWATAIDFTTQDFTKFRNFEGDSEGLKKSYKVAIGFEVIPDFTSVTSYLKRSIYRTGLYYHQTPYSQNNIQIKEFGINFGAGLPVSRESLVNLMFGYGKRGFGGDNLIIEDYFKFSLGITFRDSSWFRTRKYD